MPLMFLPCRWATLLGAAPWCPLAAIANPASMNIYPSVTVAFSAYVSNKEVNGCYSGESWSLRVIKQNPNKTSRCQPRSDTGPRRPGLLPGRTDRWVLTWSVIPWRGNLCVWRGQILPGWKQTLSHLTHYPKLSRMAFTHWLLQFTSSSEWHLRPAQHSPAYKMYETSWQEKYVRRCFSRLTEPEDEPYFETPSLSSMILQTQRRAFETKHKRPRQGILHFLPFHNNEARCKRKMNAFPPRKKGLLW